MKSSDKARNKVFLFRNHGRFPFSFPRKWKGSDTHRVVIYYTEPAHGSYFQLLFSKQPAITRAWLNGSSKWIRRNRLRTFGRNFRFTTPGFGQRGIEKPQTVVEEEIEICMSVQVKLQSGHEAILLSRIPLILFRLNYCMNCNNWDNRILREYFQLNLIKKSIYINKLNEKLAYNKKIIVIVT